MDHDTPEQESLGEPISSISSVRLEDLGELIREKRRKESLTLEKAAQQSGISPATLSRLERQTEINGGNSNSEKIIRSPDMNTLSAVTRWLGVSLARVSNFESPATAHEIEHHEGETTPDIVAAHLRADRNLDTNTAEALARMFRVAYEQFADFKPAKATGQEGKPDDEHNGSDENPS